MALQTVEQYSDGFDYIFHEIKEALIAFATTENFFERMKVVFGKNFDSTKLTFLKEQWKYSNFELLPELEIRTIDELNGSIGAYSQSNNKIYLAQEYIAQNASNPQAIIDVLFEEIGHFIDAEINVVDTPGDEGAAFKALVRGETLGKEQIIDFMNMQDTATITLDGEILEIEQAQSVSDSGGFEGSQKTITLESTGGGVARFRYQHFTIPDNFIIRYEGKNLLETGFTGGSRTGEIPIPKGNSNTLEIIVATNDEGTAWNYDVTVEICPDTKDFVIDGNFEDSDGDGDCETQDTFFIGRDGQGIRRMLRVEGGSAEYDENSLKVTGGTVYSVIGAGDVTSAPLFKGNFELDFSSGKTSSFQETGTLVNDFKVGGLDVDFSGLTVNPKGLALGAEFELLEEIGLPDFVFSGSDALLINQNNVTFGSSVKFSAPNFKNFNLFNFLPIEEFSDFSIEYVAPEDRIKIQGKLVLDPFTKTKKVGKITADLAGSNSIEIQGGQADIKGSLSVETDIDLVKGWSLKELKLDIDTKNKDIAGSTKVEFPFRAIFPPNNAGSANTTLGFKLPIPPVELNKVSIDVDNLNVRIPIPSFPFIFFQRVAGGVENIAPSDSDAVEFSGGIGATLGPQLNVPGFGRTALIRLDVDGKVSLEQLSATGKTVILNDKIARNQGTATLNWNKKFFETKGNFVFLDGLITTNDSFKVTSNFDINMGGGAAVGVPNFIPLFGGAQIASGNYLVDYSNNGTLSDDFAAGWGTINIQKFGFEVSLVAGFKGYFNGRFERIGAKNIPPTNSFIVEPGTEWIILGADWENETTENVPVNIIKPDGTVISETDFNAANRIAVVDELTDSTTKVVIVFNPEPGVWDIEVANSTGLGEIEYNAARDSIAPTINIIEPAIDVGGGNVTIEYEAFDADSDAEIKLFYDDDNEGFDGLLIADELVETDGSGSFVWNTQGVPTGEYFIYGMVMDENNIPAYSYSEGQVIISEEADLSVTQTINPESILPGENFTYTVTLANNSSTNSTGVVLTETLPEEVSLVSSSIAPSDQTDNVLTFDIGDLNGEENISVDIVVTAPLNPETLESEASVISETFDPDFTNDIDFLTITIDEAVQELPDLEVVRTDNSETISLGENYTYTLTVTNNGQGEATGVVLTETLPSVVDVISAIANVDVENNTNLVDLVEIQLDSGENVKIDIDANEFGSSLDSVLRLFDSTGNEIAVSDDNSAPDELSSLDSYIDFTASVSDTYYVGVSGFSNFDYDPFIDGSGDFTSSSGSYDLEITVGDNRNIVQGVLSEPNNTILNATDSGLSSANPGTFITSGFIRSSSNNNPVDILGNTITADLGNLEIGESVTVDITANSFGAGDLTTVTDVFSNGNDLNPVNNSIITINSISPVVPSSADLELTQTVDSLNPEVGDEISFTLTITNQGPGIASGIEVESLLPDELTFVSAIAEQGFYNSNTGIWDVGNVRDNLSRTLEINAIVDGSGSITTTSEIISVNEADPDSVPNNNNFNEDDQVSVTLNVPSDNNPPVAIDDTASTSENTVLVIDAADLLLNDTDVDGDTLSITDVDNAVNGTVTIDGTNITFTPEADFSGDASFTYIADDGNGGTDTATVNITVTPDDNQPNIIEGTNRSESLEGTNEDDIIIGKQGRDRISTGGGNDTLVYNSILERIDTVTDFEVGSDVFDFSTLLDSFSYSGSNPIADGYIGFLAYRGSSSFITVDTNGSAGLGRARPFILVNNVTVNEMNNPDNFEFGLEED